MPVTPPRRHAHAARRHPAGPDEHVDDDQRHRDVAAGAVRGRGRGARASRRPRSRGTTQNDIIKEYLSRGTYVFPPAPIAAADHRHDRLHGHRHPQVEPDQHLQLPPAGGRRDARAGDRLRDGHRDRRARRGARLGPGAGRAVRRGRRPHLVLRQRRRAVRRGDVQDARLRRAVGRPHARALRGHRRQAAPVPLRRAGELPGPDRGAAGEQRPAHRAGDARRHAVQGRPRPRHPAARVERGPGPAAAVGPAVVAAHAAGAGLRVRPAGVPRPVRGVASSWPTRRCAGRRGARGDRPRPGDGRCRCGRRDRVHEDRARRCACRPARPDRVRRGRGDRRQHVHLDRAEPAAGRPRHRDPGHRPARRAGGGAMPCSAWRAGRDESRCHRCTRGPGRGGRRAPAA